MLKVGVIGIGNCGNQIAALAMKECGCDVFAINTSENDLATLPADVPKKLVGDSEGSGKSREAAKKFLKNEIVELSGDPEFSGMATKQDVIIVVSSIGGGTGSGMAPIMYDIVRQSYLNQDGTEKAVILVGVLPKISEGYTTQVNTLEYEQEMLKALDRPTYMVYDNNKYAKMSSFKALQAVNQEIIEDIKIMQCKYNIATPFDSIDEKDMKMLLCTPGRIAFARLLDLKEKDLDETTIEDLLVSNLKTNAHAELQRDQIIRRTGLITDLSEKLNATLDTNLKKVREFVGEPVEEFVHTTINEERTLANNVCLILTGLSFIEDRINKVRDRIQEIDEAQEKANAESEGVTETDDIAAMNAKRGYREASTATGVDATAIFSKFGV